MSQYSLENLWNFSSPEIDQILRYFNSQPLNNPNDRLNAIIFSFNNNLLLPEERDYVSSPYFNQLFLASDNKLRETAAQYGLSTIGTHIQLIKNIINHIENPINVVTNLPSSFQNPIELYQIGESIFVCGSGTFPLREKLKTLGGTWNKTNKCWKIPLSNREAVKKLVQPITVSQTSPVPTQNQENLQIYQMENQVLVCGNRTFNMQDSLRSMGGTFDREIKCWTFPLEKASVVQNYITSYIQQGKIKREKVMQESQEAAARQIRMQQPEQEATFISNYDRLSPEIIEQVRREGRLWDFEAEMAKLDIPELRREWQNKIIVKKTGSGIGYTTGIVTYIGDIKPPNLAMIYAVDDWNINFGGNVQRIDYKTYKVRVNTD